MVSLNPEEKIYLIKRRHQIVLLFSLGPLIFISLLLVLSTIFFLTQASHWPGFLTKFLPQIPDLPFQPLILLILTILLIFLWMAIFFILMDYYLDYWIITNQKIMKVKVNGFFNQTSTVILLENIQDITILTKGFWETTLNFGDIYIQTAGAFRELVMEKIPYPEIVRQVIIEAKADAQK